MHKKQLISLIFCFVFLATFNTLALPPLTITTNQTDVSCNGGTNGSATATASGGIAPYTYNWNTTPAQNNATATGLAAGTYTVTASDSGGVNMGTLVVTIAQPLLLDATTSLTHVTCSGSCNGTATVTPSGGTIPYTYNWTPSGGTNTTASGLCPGSYSVIVTDSKGCTLTRNYSITQPPLLVVNTSQVNVTCNATCNGTSTATVNGGSGPYTYNWLPLGGTGNMGTGLCAGVYTVTATDSKGCTKTKSVTITEPTAININVTTINTSCTANTGQASAVATSGTSPYFFSWSTNPVQNTANATGLGVGNYTVMVTDAQGCTKTSNVIINNNAGTANITASSNVTCNGANNGSATVGMTGGNTPFTYSWNSTPSQNAATANNLPPGNYTVTIGDASSCIATATVTITEPQGMTLTTSATNTFCGQATGTATANIVGGQTPYSFSWSSTPVQNTAIANNLTAGTYTITVTDANGCTKDNPATINNNTGGTSSISAFTNVTCATATDGSATGTMTGGTGPFTYNWNTTPTQNTPTATGLAAGQYTITITDANSCSAFAVATISPPPILSVTTTQTNITCNGADDGTVTATGAGGTGPYTYQWNSAPVQNTSTATGLGAGTFTVTVTDNCGVTTTTTVIFTNPNSLTASIGAPVNITCNGGSNGSLTASTNGGTAPFNYSWNSTPAQNTQTATGLPAGDYTITITDAGGCTTTANATITEPAVSVTANITAHTDVLCFGGTTGNATATGAGGNGPYTYTWNSNPGQNTAVANNLPAGNYQVIITDANGCTATGNVTITENNDLNLTTTVTPTGCVTPDGTATVNVTGGTPGYGYAWNSTPSQNTQTATGLGVGIYPVTVTDANGCTKTTNVNIINTEGILSIIVNAPISCNGSGDGVLCAVVVNGSPAFTYLWNTTETTQCISGLSAGSYSVMATDANGCTMIAAINLDQPPDVTLTGTSTDATCGQANGTTTVVAAGGTLPYTYSWSTIPVQTTATATGLLVGTYTVFVDDANNCGTDIAITVNQPNNFASTITQQTDVKCYDDSTGSATVTGTGGNLPYSYSWNTSPQQTTATGSGLIAGLYSVTITDACLISETHTVTITQPVLYAASLVSKDSVSCNGLTDGAIFTSITGGITPYSYSWNSNPIQNTANATGLPAGIYTLTVTDSMNCVAILTDTIFEPNIIAITKNITATVCSLSTGTANITTTGGTAAYTYSWSTAPSQSDSIATGLAEGIYTVTITDQNNCSLSDTVFIFNNAGVVTANVISNAACYADSNGSAEVNIIGGQAPYSYSWNTIPPQTDTLATNLLAGTYLVSVTDSNNCVKTDSVTITQPTGIIANLTTSLVTCYGLSDGSITSAPTGGSGGYIYSWSGTIQTTSSITGLVASLYTVTITDINGCSISDTITLFQPDSIQTLLSQTSVTCNNGNNGTTAVTVSGGTAPYLYEWNTNPVQYAATLNTLIAGTYAVLITDANNCTHTDSITVTEPAALNASTNYTSVKCSGSCDASVDITPNGGIPPYTYNWAPVGGTVASSTNVCAGTYTVTIADSNNCTTTQNFTISQPPVLVTTVSNVDLVCYGDSVGSATIIPVGGVPPYVYSWSTLPSQTTSTASNIPAGTYTVSVADSVGCVRTRTVIVNQPQATILTITTQKTDCTVNNGEASVTVSNGIAPYFYSWSTDPIQNTATATGLGVNTYTLTVIDDNGCDFSDTAQIKNKSGVATIAPTNVTCFGIGNGTAYATITGGLAPFTYTWSTNPAQSDSVATGLAPGTYTIITTDAGICVATATVTITEPAILTATMNASTLLCYNDSNGTATSTANGGIQPYNYQWNTIPQQLVATATGLKAGDYEVTVTDNNGCTLIDTASIFQPTQLLSATTYNAVTCNGLCNGIGYVTPSQATPPYSYSWLITTGTDSVQNSLCAGTYTMIITDANGCSKTDSVIVTQPTPVVANSTGIDAHCFLPDGSAAATAAGGSPGYVYTWLPINQVSDSVLNILAGTYTIIATDSLLCNDTITLTINNIPGVSTLISNTTKALCHDSCNGTATVVGSGGQIPYIYSWQNNQTDSLGTGLCAGNYSVVTTDNWGCKDTSIATVSEPPPFNVSFNPVDTICMGGNTTLIATASGGTPAYTYFWIPGGMQNDTVIVSPQSTTTYSVILVDSNNCASLAFNMNVPVHPPITLTAAAAQICFGDSVQLSVAATGGNGGPYLFTWVPQNDSTSSIYVKPTADSVFTVIAQDKCETPFDTIQIPVTVYSLPIVQFTPSSADLCLFNCLKFLNTSTPSNASFTWDFDDGYTDTTHSPSHCYSKAGNFDVSLTAIDSNGCKKTLMLDDSVRVHMYPEADFSFDPQQPTVLVGDVNFHNLTTLYSPIQTWEWHFGDADENTSDEEHTSFTYTDTGSYVITLIATDIYGCADSTFQIVTVKEDYAIYIPNAFTPNGDGLNEFFRPEGYGIDKDHYEFWIYDRWGNEIYHTTDYYKPWDGKANRGSEVAQIDVYIWVLSTKDVLGASHYYEGHVSLIK